MIKKSKIIKKKVASKKTENQMMVLLEDIRDQVKIVAEGHVGLDKKIDSVHNELKNEIQSFKHDTESNFKVVFKHINEMEDFKHEMDGFKHEMGAFKHDTESNFKTVFQHFSNIEDELKIIKMEISELKTMLFKKADLERLVVLEQKVATLERQLAK